ncbi:MAG: B12-binding domain-containing radical SAM protein [Nitrospirae bacterium CG_4_10_14_3_um_filter_44_29]|nr:B12-binding domain-containing radical SAM protein [Nitrospirota bacterium]OIO28633.1 MAG: hypothetical protein AUJ60_07070 [Nitrospirae bacterium CG1_02_44_142]PIP70050.1 MAG: B12-binding domain-containing radical SAM protein [Nitrospirae bacterium CG22_combo_CG10-13_8_21_14_all_44_11]PIV43592.1 MAG: B12-binding domain-containing radical SAM protein [Nitrospirae bacterium CG02_land_8_20_14_3_00_44_33]PIV65581.1 MAG: B12-binding domain-containing radical SAM protein [Nitrospirae bacterium CG0
MKICLINPSFPLSLWDFSLCRDIDGSAFPFPPLSLATLAALTPMEHEVAICDENIKPVDFDTDADIVGITGCHIQKERVYQLAGSFRSKGKTVAIGGPLVQKSNLGECAEHADAVFLGEAEYTWPSFIRDFQSGNAKFLYEQEEFVDLTASPAPRFDLLELPAYSTAIIETSRGCPHSCEFCEIPIRLGKRPRNKSAEQVMTEIRSLYALGADSIFIIDDNFFGNRKRALELLSEIKRFVKSIDYRVYFSCQFTIDISREEEILILMNKANFRRVFVGIETPRQLSLTMSKKNQNTNIDLLNAVRRIQANNIIVWGAFIVGFDGDDANIFNEQLRFIQAAAIPVAMVGILQAIPGTPLYERIKKEERLRDNEACGIRGAANSLVQTNITPLNMSLKELAEGYGFLVRNLYSYDNFAERLINAVKLGKRHGLKGRTQISKKGILTLLRLLNYYVLSTDLRRIYMFMRIIVQTLLHNPQHLYTALMHLVVYKHLKQFYERGTSFN